MMQSMVEDFDTINRWQWERSKLCKAKILNESKAVNRDCNALDKLYCINHDDGQNF